MGDIEAKTIAWCTKKGHGSRLMPAGTITGAHVRARPSKQNRHRFPLTSFAIAQFVRTSAYIQITGRLQQSGVGLDPSDQGGELDPHGADLLGNPLGGLVYSSGMPTGDNSTLQQVISWNKCVVPSISYPCPRGAEGDRRGSFVGDNMFCIKLCDNSIRKPNYCEKSALSAPLAPCTDRRSYDAAAGT